jgi:phosphoglycerol transferase
MAVALDDGIVTACAALVFAGFLWCTVGGFGSIFNTFVTPLIRGYNRIIGFFVFFILAAYEAVASALLARNAWARAHRLAGGALLVFVTRIAFADVLWIPTGIQTPAERTAASDRAFASTVEHALGGHGMVFQISYTAYPTDGDPGKISPFDHARPYLQSSADLQWSWGTGQGTAESRWMQGVARLTPDNLISEIVQDGFRGLWIDTYGYAGNPADMPAKAFATLLGQKPLASPGGRHLFFNLTSAHAAPVPAPVESAGMPFNLSKLKFTREPLALWISSIVARRRRRPPG